MENIPTTNETKGQPESMTNKILETGAAATQNFAPPKRVCAHLNAFHAYANDPTRCVETNHYCAHLNDGMPPMPVFWSNARLIGIEYMISARLYDTLDQEERKYWHSHVFEVKSGMLLMPRPTGVPEAVWEVAENKEMEEVVTLYGKIFHLWQTDKGHKLPLGEPQLMTSYTDYDQFDFDQKVGDRDRRFGEDHRHKHADAAWKEAGTQNKQSEKNGAMTHPSVMQDSHSAA
ncbi:unnamed protein product [Aureobasidium vineae]|uniref:DUF1264-domain-containing protein n=1 Tax=Aureobasidium vineae TaxID=2773715 RepID=A0A9N8K5B3_9PEZI|nr:unnamed protein product [Aureobasidium vineae]